MKHLRLLIVALGLGIGTHVSAIEFTQGIFTYTTIDGSETDVSVKLASDDKTIVPEDVVMPTTVEFLGKTYNVLNLDGWLFSGCKQIKTVKLPEKMANFGGAVFEDCEALEEITLPETVKWIGDYCFIRCSSLKKINLPEGLEVICPNAFCDTKALTQEIVIPNSVTTLGRHAFMGSAISKVVFGEGITEVPEGCFAWCQNLAEIVVPANITMFGAFAFQTMGANYPEGLPSVNIGAPEVIVGNAFADSGVFHEVVCEAVTPPVLAENGFTDATYAGKLMVPIEALEAYKADPAWSKFAVIEGYERQDTGINDVTVDINNAPVYNLQGVRVADRLDEVVAPGIYICAGKKIMIRR